MVLPLIPVVGSLAGSLAGGFLGKLVTVSAAAVGAVGAKLLYDAVSSSSVSNSVSERDTAQQLRSEKTKRTKKRKKIVKKILRSNRTLLIENLNSQLLGVASITQDTDGEYDVSFDKIDEIILSMKTMMHPPIKSNKNNEKYRIKFCNISDMATEIVNKANNEYGELSGIDAQDKYVQDQDTFITSFKSAAREALI